MTVPPTVLCVAYDLRVGIVVKKEMCRRVVSMVSGEECLSMMLSLLA